MLRIENIETGGIASAVRGMRNPLNSWSKSDSIISAPVVILGKSDLELMQRLISAGSDERKFMRCITASFDVVAPLYWWKQFDAYKVGVVTNSCSTMHTIMDKPFAYEDFSFDYLGKSYSNKNIVDTLNSFRIKYLCATDSEVKKKWWTRTVQLLPCAYNQRRTVSTNYETLRNMYFARRNHKLDEWRTFCNTLEQFPYGKELICYDPKK